MAIRDWPAEERPREKLINKGAAALSDAELLAIFLRTGVKGKSAVDLARQLLIDMGGLRTLLHASQAEFQRQHGLGQAKYCLLQAVLEMSRRHLNEQLKQHDALTSPQLVKDYLASALRHKGQEVFAVLMLDTQHRAIKLVELFHGTIDGAAVYPREVVKAVLTHQAAAVILAHNHPSGISEASQADRVITRRLQQALALIDVPVLDHLIVGDGEFTSFLECGWL